MVARADVADVTDHVDDLVRDAVLLQHVGNDLVRRPDITLRVAEHEHRGLVARRPKGAGHPGKDGGGCRDAQWESHGG